MINKKKITWVIILILFFLNIGVFSKVLILPFKTEKELDKSYYWFSRAISFYLSTKLNSIDINSYTDAEVNNIINVNSIHFPYRITKASAIRIGLMNNANKIIWGKINISKEKDVDAMISIRSYIIDTISLDQLYLPIIKGKVKDISLIQQELLNSIIKKLGISKNLNGLDTINFDNQSYELFIKSLLSLNSKEKKNLLNNSLNIIKNSKSKKVISDLIKFELAKIYLEEANLDIVEKHLKEISSNSIILKNKNFLMALLDSDRENYKDAINKFLNLKNQNSFSEIIDNNLGVLFIKTGDFLRAEKHLLETLKKKQNITTYNNLLNLYLKNSEPEKIKRQVIEVLNLFPKNINYISLLNHFILKDKNKEILLVVFNDFLENRILIDYYKLELPLNYINPFDISINNDINNGIEINSIFQFRDIKNDGMLSLEDYLQKLETNPFNFKIHLILSELYLKKKQFRKAEMHGIFSFFLNRSKKTVKNLMTLYKLLGDSSKHLEFKVILDGFYSEK